MSLKNGGSPLVATAYSYDGMSRLASVGGAVNGQQATVNASYSRIPGSSLLSSTNFTNGSTNLMAVARSYDNLNRLTSISSVESVSSVGYTYNNSDERTKVTLADNRYIDYTYDDAGQIESAKRYHPSESQDYGYNYGYTYDPMGNPATKSTQGQSRTYTANDLNQIATATAPTTTDLVGKVAPELTAPYTVTVNGQSATVDSEGNFVKQGVALSSGANQITVNATDKFGRTDQKIVNVTLASAPIFTYGPDGNLTSDGTWTYTWNDENRLVSAVRSAGVPPDDYLKVEFTYDGFGRRRVKKVSTWNSDSWLLTSESRFAYDVEASESYL